MVAAAEFRALGTGVRVVTTDPGARDAACRIVERDLDAIDASCSRFRADSELSALNRTAGRWTPIGPLLCQALAAAVRTARMTDGAVDPTVGGAMRAIGYDRDFRLVLGTSEIPRPVPGPVPGWRAIELDQDLRRVRIREDVELDLGSSAKALAADLAAGHAARAVGGGVLVSVGGDIAASGPPPGGGWAVLIGDDHDAPLDGPGQVVTLEAGGLATSSTTVRRWVRGGREFHHIVDPWSGLPVTPLWRTVSVAATTCVDANAAATACIVWRERAPGYLARHSLPARLVRTDGSVLRLGGWPAEVGS